MKKPRFTRHYVYLTILGTNDTEIYRVYGSSWLEWNFVIYLPVVHRLYLIQSSTCRSILKPAALEIHAQLALYHRSQVVHPASLHFVGRHTMSRAGTRSSRHCFFAGDLSENAVRIAMIRDDKNDKTISAANDMFANTQFFSERLINDSRKHAV